MNAPALFDSLPNQVSLARQIEAAERELGKRRTVYPKLVNAGSMSPVTADEEIACQVAILATLRRVAEAERQKAPVDTNKVKAAFESVDAPLPWTGETTGKILDANNKVVVSVDFTGRMEQPKRERLTVMMVRAVNRLGDSAEGA